MQCHANSLVSEGQIFFDPKNTKTWRLFLRALIHRLMNLFKRRSESSASNKEKLMDQEILEEKLRAAKANAHMFFGGM